MNDQEAQSDADLESQAAKALSRDLKRLYQSPGPVPDSIDRTILSRLPAPSRRPYRIRVYRALAALAALIGIVIGLLVFRQGETNISTHEQARISTVARTDIDQNGTVNILDAFCLAKHIKSQQPTRPTWDLNTDGRINQADVDLVANTAVRIHRRELL
jgi:hypothetical protein